MSLRVGREEGKTLSLQKEDDGPASLSGREVEAFIITTALGREKQWKEISREADFFLPF